MDHDEPSPRAPSTAGTSASGRGGPRDWDGTTYDRIADPMTRWGSAVLDRLPLRGDETVVDAGCGSGRVTEQLLGRLPRGRVIAVDGSRSMLDAASERLGAVPGGAARVTFLEADLGRPLPLADASVDAVLSTATFHWIRDHESLFANLARILRPRGRLVAQCGGAGNIASVLRAVEQAGETWIGPWTFATPEATSARVEAAGFTAVETWLQDEPTRIEPGAPLREYLRSVILGAHLERLPVDRRDAFIDGVAEHLPDGVIDYVRLNIMAVRAG